MQISEVEPDKKIVISKVDFVCDLIAESRPKPLPQTYNHFFNSISPTCMGVPRVKKDA